MENEKFIRSIYGVYRPEVLIYQSLTVNYKRIIFLPKNKFE